MSKMGFLLLKKNLIGHNSWSIIMTYVLTHKMRIQMSVQLWEHSLLVQKWYHVTKNPSSMLISIINPQQQFCTLRQPLNSYIKNALVKREFWDKLLRQSWAVVEWYVEWYAPPAGFNSGASLILSEYKKPVSIQHSLAIYTGEREEVVHIKNKNLDLMKF